MAKVLVVDDSPVDLRMASHFLDKEPKWDILQAVDGKQALQRMREHVPDVVVTDLAMPNMNGLELVTAARRTFPETPVILMTAKGSESIAVEALQLGAASYIPKRRMGRDLRETVRRILSASREERNHTQLMGRLTGLQQSFVLDNELSHLLAMAGYLQQLHARTWLCDKMERMRVGTALEEALTNAFYHGNLEMPPELREDNPKLYYQLVNARRKQEPYRSRKVFVEARLTLVEATYVIGDEGPGFDVASLPDPADPTTLTKASGRGIMLMRTFMDDVQFYEAGNEVSLIRHRFAERGPETVPPDGLASAGNQG